MRKGNLFDGWREKKKKEGKKKREHTSTVPTSIPSSFPPIMLSVQGWVILAIKLTLLGWSIAVLANALIVVREVRVQKPSNVNQTRLDFVHVSLWIEVGLLAAAALFVIATVFMMVYSLNISSMKVVAGTLESGEGVTANVIQGVSSVAGLASRSRSRRNSSGRKRSGSR